MAKVAYSPLITAIRKKLGTSVFTINRYGAVIRKRVKGINPRTTAQTNIRGDFSAATKAWKALTAAQRAGWAALASTLTKTDVYGKSYTLAPNALFTQVQTHERMLGITPATAAVTPSGTIPAAPLSVAAVSSTGVVTVTTGTQAASTGYYVIKTSPGLSPGVTYGGSKLRIAAINAASASATTTTATPATYNSKLAFTSGSQVIVRVQLFDTTGYYNSAQQFSVIAT